LALPPISIRLHGYCHTGKESVAALIAGDRADEVPLLGGSFVAVATRGDETWIATSALGAVQYFVAVHDGRLVHGPTVDGVAQPWRWNLQAVADYFAIDHVVGRVSLVEGVRQTPAASLLHWDGSRLDERVLEPPLDAEGSPDAALEELVAETRRCAGDAPVVSASAGFDSRVLIAALLAAGIEPTLAVIGPPGGTDRTVVESIGARFGLEVRAVELTDADFLEDAEAVSRLSSGTKPVGHWHTYSYAKRLRLEPGRNLLVGANGEFARSYYLDKGLAARVADLLPPSLVLRALWSRKIRRLGPVLHPSDRATMPSASAELLLDHGCEAARLAATGRGRTLARLDRFYLEQRLPTFIGDGLALYGAFTSWRAPFLGAGWVAEAARLPRSWRLGEHWHRYAIERLCPRLLDVPEGAGTAPLAARPPRLYWLRSHGLEVPYVDYRALFADERLHRLLLDRAELLDDLVGAATVHRIVEQHRRDGSRLAAIAKLVPLALWRSNK
jgi:asparagine synthase (glutamine-hydrolysing)